MRLGQVVDMDIIADAGSVWRVIVFAKDGYGRAYGLGGLDDEGDQMRFRMVVFAVECGGSGSIEIAQSRILEAVDSVVPVQDALKSQLGFAVGVDGSDRGIVGNRLRSGRP